MKLHAQTALRSGREEKGGREKEDRGDWGEFLKLGLWKAAYQKYMRSTMQGREN